MGHYATWSRSSWKMNLRGHRITSCLESELYTISSKCTQAHKQRVCERVPVLQSNSEEAGPPGFDLRYWSSWRLVLISSPLGVINITSPRPGVRPFLGKTYKFHRISIFFNSSSSSSNNNNWVNANYNNRIITRNPEDCSL